MTKEELIIENTKLEQELKTAQEGELGLRKEFAKAFNWYKRKEQYETEAELEEPSWSEIFVEIGKLLSIQKYKNINDKVEAMDSNIIVLFEDIDNLSEKINENKTNSKT